MTGQEAASILYKAFPSEAFKGLSERQRSDADMVAKHLHSLGSLVHQVADLVALAEYCETTPAWQQHGLLTTSWIHLAAQGIAITIHDIHRAMALAINHATRVDTLNARINKQTVDIAMKLFTRYFPDAKKMRNAVGHRVDFTGTEKSAAENAVKGRTFIPGLIDVTGTVNLGSAIAQGKMSTTAYGRLMTLDITNNTVVNLVEVTRCLYGAFALTPTDASRP